METFFRNPRNSFDGFFEFGDFSDEYLDENII